MTPGRRERARRGAALAAALGVGACAAASPTPTPHVEPAPSAAVAPEPTASATPTSEGLSDAPIVDARAPVEEAAARAWLLAATVTEASFARRVLFTWTTAAQIEEAEKTGVLLARSKSKKGQIALFDRLLDEHPEPLFSRALHKPALAKRRFAWPEPWATSRGFSGEIYGDRLVRVVLKRDAIIGHYDASDAPPWSFVTLTGQWLDEQEAADRIDKLAAVYHVYTAKEIEWSNEGPSAHRVRPYREYVLCNESMIEEWSVATPEVAKKLDDDLHGLATLREVLARKRSAEDATKLADPSAWARVDAKSELAALWGAATALPDEASLFDVKHLDELGRTLEALFPTDASFRRAPTAPFEGVDMRALARAPIPKPVPKLVPKCRGTMCY